nr:DUF1330 domain-containing protein [Sphingobium subterraneum]
MSASDGTPIVVVNLLKFRERALYPSDAPEHALGLSGRDAYQRYADASLEILAERGGAVLLQGTAPRYLVGQGDWDAVWINRYPGKQAYAETISDPRLPEILRHRAAGLDHQHAFITRPIES